MSNVDLTDDQRDLLHGDCTLETLAKRPEDFLKLRDVFTALNRDIDAQITTRKNKWIEAGGNHAPRQATNDFWAWRATAVRTKVSCERVLREIRSAIRDGQLDREAQLQAARDSGEAVPHPNEIDYEDPWQVAEGLLAILDKVLGGTPTEREWEIIRRARRSVYPEASKA